MPILTGDIKLVASQVMDDVPEGGGAPTSVVVADGVSNAIFPDISELDRAGGRVNLRKLHVSVQTDDRDTYLGSNIIVAEPPADPNVSVTLFTTESTFDRRTNASSRIESYLTSGPTWPGVLYENHIMGQRSIQILQEVQTELPNIGRTLVLVQNEGAGNAFEQYVRATTVESVTRIFYDATNGAQFEKAVVTVGVSDALRYDFMGSPATKNLERFPGAARVRDTTVADAGVYAGVVPLAQTADIGDFTLNASSVYTQLVPSAQTESPILDIRTNGMSAALVATGGPLVQSISMGFTTTANMHVGGPILPGTLSIERSGVTATDKGGLLISAATEVGQVDYDNGIVSLSTNVWGTGAGTHTVTFTPAAVPDLVSDQRAIRVTAESRSLNYVLTLNPALPRTMTVSYLAQGRWYVLRDAGAGILEGISSAYGIGTINYTTGSVQVTLGALPDVGSSIVIQSYSALATVQASNTMLSAGSKLFVPINSDGLVSEARGSKAFERGQITVSWSDGTAKTAQDNGQGQLTGDGTGTIDYANGVVRLSPNTLPPPGTVFTIGSTPAVNNMNLTQLALYNANPPTYTSTPGSPGHTIPATVSRQLVTPGTSTPRYPAPGTISQTVTRQVNYYIGNASGTFAATFVNRAVTLTLQDDGMGGLFAMLDGIKTAMGSVDYATGLVNMAYELPLPDADPKGPVMLSSTGGAKSWNDYLAQYPTNSPFPPKRHISGGAISTAATYTYTPDVYEDVSVAAVEVPPTNPVVSTMPTIPPEPTLTIASAQVSQYFAQVLMVPNYTLKGVGFSLGAVNYAQISDGTLLSGVSPTTGGGTPVGAVGSVTGKVELNAWTAGVASTLTNWRGLIAPPSVGVAAPFTAFSTSFRTASSPLRPGSLSVLGTMQDGTAFNVTAGTDGKINGTRVKGRVDYQYGLVELNFVNPDGNTALNVDLSHLQIAGLTTIPADLAMLSTLRYNAVAFSYLPLDADLLGIDPVRLPSDGRVPIFRAGGFAVVGHTGKITATVSNGQTIDCARVRLSRVRVVGFDKTVINTGYTADLEAGTLTFTNVTGYSQPVTIEHRIEDMGVVRDVQISGEVTFTRPITHDYPMGSYLSSALVAGDLKSRVSVFFDQATWTNVWSDALLGSSAVATYNDVLAPVLVTNRGALTERWALVFTNSTTFNVIGENVGVIATGSVNADLAPLNPSTGVPYFTVPAVGWGIGWAAGNVLRFNTIGAMSPVWVVRTVQQGPNTGIEHAFTILSRGDVDRP